MNHPLFLIGAGFNADAANDEYRYPLARDLPGICGFPPPPDKSVEEAFAGALRDNPYEPMEKLKHALMMADCGLALSLASQRPNSYRQFFQKFAGSHFLTFNYDSLAETILFALGRWYPHNGYGVPVTTDLGREDVPAELKTGRSSSLVLHLHGSFCLFTSDHEIQQGLIAERKRPVFYFVPDSVFPSYTTPSGALARRTPDRGAGPR